MQTENTPRTAESLSLIHIYTTQFEIRKPEVGLFEPVLRVTRCV